MEFEKRADYWLGILGKKEFPREVGIGENGGNWFQRKSVKNAQEYVETLISNQSCNLYVSMLSERQIENEVFDKMFIDIDKTIDDAYDLMVGMSKYLESRYGAETLKTCSGGKGYHVIMYFDEVEVDRRIFRIWERNVIKDSIETVFPSSVDKYMKMIDTTVLGDLRQVFRLPYTLNHSKMGKTRFCHIIKNDWNLKKIKSVILEPKPVEINIKKGTGIKNEIEECKEKHSNILETPDIDMMDVIDSNHDEYKRELKMLMENSERINDGRKRMVSFLIIPRLVALGYDRKGVRVWTYRWLEKSGEIPSEYDTLIDKMYERTIEGDGERQWLPWSFERFFGTHEELIDEFDKNK